MKRTLILSGLVVMLFGAAVWANLAQTPAAAGAATMSGEAVAAEGRAEMERFMTSGRMTQAMTGMMQMARQMGNGDAMAGMVRMMEMMAGMGQMGGQMDGMMGPGRPQPSK